jgi:site-specific DNA-cytosine methylase
MKHASIIPLIGGISLASDEVYGTKPKWIASYDVFGENDSHLLNHYEFKNHNVPYYVLDNNERKPTSKLESVDVVSTVCPCAGLSTMSHHSGADNPTNDWMAVTAKYVLENIKPKVFWGENAPTFAGDTGKKIRDKIFEIGKKNGYTMTIYKTKSLLHGLPQYRQRSFYFFWKEKDHVPLMNYYKRPYPQIKDFIDNIQGNSQQEATNLKPLRDNYYYSYVMDKMHPGLTHAEFVDQLDKSYELTGYIRKQGITFPELATYFRKEGLDKEADKCDRRHEKLQTGGGIMTRALYVPKDYTGAFVGHLPRNMTHPVEERFLTYRECMGMMGLPQDFELLNPNKNLNHICQNVPFTTAKDMATEVLGYLNGDRPMIKANQLLQNNHKHEHKVWDASYNSLEGFIQ